MTDEQVSERLAELPGRLAIGDGPALGVASPDGLSLQLLDGSDTINAGQPTWSHDGTKLAWSSVSSERQVVLIQTFADDGTRPEGPETTGAAGPPVFYLQWNEADDRLAYIRNAPDGGAVEVGTIDPGRPAEAVGRGAPFFISWSPAPDRLLGHVNGESIDAFAAADPPEAGFTTVLDEGGEFSAPAWLDEQRVLIVIEGALTVLDLRDGTATALLEVNSPIRFVLSPDKSKVAFQAIGGGGGPVEVGLSDRRPIQADGDALSVLDLQTEELTTVTTDLAVAWEWSPDSDKLAWLGVDQSSGRPLGEWHFWSETAPPAIEQSFGFTITRKFGQNYLPFFAQYAQSVTGWSPDSSAFAFAGVIDRERGVWVQLVTETVAPRLVAPGDFVTWGIGDAPPPTGQGASAA